MKNQSFSDDSRGQLLIGITAIIVIGLLILGTIINGGLFIESQVTQPTPDNEYRGELIETAYAEYSSAMYVAEQNRDSQTEIENELDSLGSTLDQMWRFTYVGTYSIERDSTQLGERVIQTNSQSLSRSGGTTSYSLGTADSVRRIELRPDTTNLTATTPENLTSTADVFNIEWESGSDRFTTYFYENSNTSEATVEAISDGETLYRGEYEDGDSIELITGSMNGASIYTTPTEFNGGTVAVRLDNTDSIESEFIAIVNPVGGNPIRSPQGGVTETAVYQTTHTVTETTPQDTTTYTMRVRPCHIGEQVCSYP